MKDIKGFEDRYAITEDGEVWSYLLGKFLKPSRDTNRGKRAYLLVVLYKNKKANSKRIHRLIAQAYIPNPLNFPCINHKNGIKTDNRIENLEWCTYSENNIHALRHGLRKVSSLRGEAIGNSKLKTNQIREIRRLRREGSTLKSIGNIYNVSFRTIWDVTSGRHWKHV